MAPDQKGVGMSRVITTEAWLAELERITAISRKRPDGMRTGEIVRATGLSSRLVMRMLHDLAEQGRLVVTHGLAPDITGINKPTHVYRMVTPKAAKRR